MGDYQKEFAKQVKFVKIKKEDIFKAFLKSTQKENTIKVIVKNNEELLLYTVLMTKGNKIIKTMIERIKKDCEDKLVKIIKMGNEFKEQENLDDFYKEFIGKNFVDILVNKYAPNSRLSYHYRDIIMKGGSL